MTENMAAAYGMFLGDAALQEIVQTLNRSGFDKEHICMMVSPKHPIATIVREANLLHAERDSGVATDTIGWLMKFGAVMIPSVGFFVRSEAFFPVLVAKKDPAAVYGNSRALVGLGLCEGDALRFAFQLREMGALVYVACPENGGTIRAVEALHRSGARETAALGKEMAKQAVA